MIGFLISRVVWKHIAFVFLGVACFLAPIRADATTFRWQSLKSYLQGSNLKVLRKYLRRSRCAAATKESRRHKWSQVKARGIWLLLGRCWMDQREWTKARRALKRASSSRYLLRDYVALWIGDTWREQGKIESAVKAYLQVSRGSLQYPATRLRAAKMLLEAGKARRALGIIKKIPVAKTNATHWWVAVQAAYALGRTGRRDASRWATRILVKEPASGEAGSVKAWRRRRKLRIRLTKRQKIAQAMKFNRHFLYNLSLKALRRVRLSRRAPHVLRCQLYYAKGFAWFRKRRYRRAIPFLRRARKVCRGVKRLDIRTLYYLGHAYRRRGLWRRSIPYLREMAKRFPKHYLADDGLFMIADSADRRGRKREAKRYYRELMRRFPRGDMSFVARWRIAYQAYRYRKWTRALKLFRRIYKKYPKSRYAPVSLYYAARATQRLPKRNRRRAIRLRVIGLYRQLVRDYPLHYYSFLALTRLRRLVRRPWLLQRCRWTKTAKGLRCITLKNRRSRRRVQVVPWGPLPTRPPTSNELLQLFDGVPAPYLTHPGYLRGRELFRLGMRARAASEWWGLVTCKVFGSTSQNRRRCGKRGQQGAELLGLHFHLAGLYHLADRVYRGRGTIAGRLPFVARTLRSWYLAYPRPFLRVVRKAATRDRVNMYTAYGIMREESTFRPDIQSRSNAYGLMQLLLSTARNAARTLRMRRRIQPDDLFQPEINIPIGIRHLRFLHKQFKGQLPLMAGAYNAGSRRVKSWLRRFGRYSHDKWVEAITIKQTRHYVRRVSQSYSIYHFLYAPARQRWWRAIPFPPHRPPRR